MSALGKARALAVMQPRFLMSELLGIGRSSSCRTGDDLSRAENDYAWVEHRLAEAMNSKETSPAA